MKKNILILGLCLLSMGGCSLDYENKGAITPDNVWKDKNMINGFLNDIYGRMLPGWPVSANNTDEGMNSPTSLSDFARGNYSVELHGRKLDYGNIDRINFFLEKLDNEVTILSEAEKNTLKGQALFWRAWDYFGKVNTVGGVPLILKVQDRPTFLPCSSPVTPLPNVWHKSFRTWMTPFLVCPMRMTIRDMAASTKVPLWHSKAACRCSLPARCSIPTMMRLVGKLPIRRTRLPWII